MSDQLLKQNTINSDQLFKIRINPYFSLAFRFALMYQEP